MDWKSYGEWRRTVYPYVSWVYYGQLLFEFIKVTQPEKLIYKPYITGSSQSPGQRPREVVYGYKNLPGSFSVSTKELETIEKNIETIKLYKELTKIEEEKQVTVHCKYIGSTRIRIWKSTFLCAHNSSHRSKLIHVDNITLYPEWTPLEKVKKTGFTLIFNGLPKHCDQFDLIEDIPEPGGFIVKNIKRNSSDVYLIEVQ